MIKDQIRELEKLTTYLKVDDKKQEYYPKGHA